MEIHRSINDTKCIILIITNGESKHQIPLLLSSVLKINNETMLTDTYTYGSYQSSSSSSSASMLASSANGASGGTAELSFDHVDYTLDIVMPLIVGLVVAMILGWMLIRYKMSAHQRSNYNGSIYCCPDECFLFCARFFKCNLRFKLSNFKKTRNDSASMPHPQIIIRNSDVTTNIQPNQQVELELLNSKKSSPVLNRSSIKSNTSSSTLANVEKSNSSSTLQIPQFNFSNPLRFLRDSIPSRRESMAMPMPDLMRSNFSTNLFLSFQSKNSTTIA